MLLQGREKAGRARTSHPPFAGVGAGRHVQPATVSLTSPPPVAWPGWLPHVLPGPRQAPWVWDMLLGTISPTSIFQAGGRCESSD